MNKHEVKITDFGVELEDVFSDRPEYITGGITVKPPISVGELFTRAILGPDQDEVVLSEVVSTSEVTVFVAKVAKNHQRKDSEDCKVAIETITLRIAKLVNNPASIIDLMKDNPFSEYRGRPL